MEEKPAVVTRLASSRDVAGVLKLQEKYLLAKLSEGERRKGFVTTPFSEAQLRDLFTRRGVFVADAEGDVVGYVMAGTWIYFCQWDIFEYMVARLPTELEGRSLSAENTFQYGPVCIDESQRGTGLFPKLFETMRLEFAPLFPFGLTFINRVNTHSHHAHVRKLGMKVVDEFTFTNKAYYTLAFDASASVLG